MADSILAYLFKLTAPHGVSDGHTHTPNYSFKTIGIFFIRLEITGHFQVFPTSSKERGTAKD